MGQFDSGRRSGSRGFLYYGLANVVSACVPFVLLPVLTRVLPPSDFGLLSVFAVCVSAGTVLIGLGTHGAVSVSYFRLDEKSFREHTASVISVGLVSFFVLQFILLIASRFELFVGQLELRHYQLASIVSLFIFLLTVRLVVLQVTAQAKWYASYKTVQAMLDVCASLLFVVLLELGVDGRMWGQLLAVALVGLYASEVLRRKVVCSASITRTQAASAISFGFGLLPHSVASVVLLASDRIVVVGILGFEEAGHYMANMQIAMVLLVITTAFNKVYAPGLMKYLAADKEKRTSGLVVVKWTYIYFICLVGAALIYWALMRSLAPLLLGDSFRFEPAVLLAGSLGYAFGGMYFTVTNYLFFFKKTIWLSSVTVLTSIFSVVVTVISVKAVGAVGAAFSFMLVQIIFFVATWYQANRVCNMPWLSFREILTNGTK